VRRSASPNQIIFGRTLRRPANAPDSLRRRIQVNPAARRRRLARFMNAPPVQPFKQRRQLCADKSHHAVFDLRPAEDAVLQPLGEQAQTRAIPEDQLDPVRPLGPEHIDRPRERIRRMVSRTSAASPSAPLRKSTGLVATITRTAPVGPITRRLSTPAAPLHDRCSPRRGRSEPSHRRSQPRSFRARLNLRRGIALRRTRRRRRCRIYDRRHKPQLFSLQKGLGFLQLPPPAKQLLRRQVRAAALRRRPSRRCSRSRRQSAPCPRRSTSAGDPHR
jgi:hypothetical protein